ncbi:MAG: hypothetical protein IKU30_05775 [Clostridia bacterium]|nr:hypothetical protein [Clostridia bacterium]
MNEKQKTKLAKEIIAYRAMHDLSQERFALACRVSRPTIMRAEQGRPIRKTSELRIRQTMEEGEW